MDCKIVPFVMFSAHRMMPWHLRLDDRPGHRTLSFALQTACSGRGKCQPGFYPGSLRASLKI